MSTAIQTLNAHVNLRSGPGSSKYLAGFIKERGWWHYPGVVVDAGLEANQYFTELHSQLLGEFPRAHVLTNRVSGPSYEYLDACVKDFRNKKIDCMVAIGGGSTLDLAKAISVLLTNPGEGIRYRGVNKIKNPGVPLILIPTTAGTGSEVIPNAPFTDTRGKIKQGISTSFYHPELVILDPLLTVSCPKTVTVTAGMDAMLHHAIDAFISDDHNAICGLFAREAVRLIFNALPKVVENPSDIAMRGDMQLGAMYAGIALSNGGGGSIAGAMSYPLEVHHHIAHGMGVAACGLEVVYFNITKGYYGYGFFGDYISTGRINLHSCSEENAWVFYYDLKNLYSLLGVPRLSDLKVPRRALSRLAKEMSTMTVLNRNPVPICESDVLAILQSCW